ncbi:MAG TPA: superoxide dismutase [Chitinophagales bacterium]|nr:superoxide dismutase [Chitinophagales bacterium]
MKTTTKNSRRDFIKKSALAAAGSLTFLSVDWQKAFAGQISMEELTQPGNDGVFTLPALPYSYGALEPYIDAQTMEIHYTKHHQKYVDNLNAAIAKAPELKGKSIGELLSMIDSLPDGVRAPIRNNGGGHWNHSFFWQILAPKSDMMMPSGKLKEAMVSQWQTFDNFKDQFKQAGLGVFGSGWVWMIADQGGKLSIVNTPNQDNTMMDIAKDKGKPIIGIDVWEHAYYLKYQNKRTDYLDAVWNVISWKKAMELYG